ncbi:MAG: A/G-specific adenine glycosylase [Bacteroidota bacterium]
MGKPEKLAKRLFADWLITWYQVNKRALPWRNTQDPYRIWLSEVILQQTRVLQGLPYYQRFVEQYPTVRALAKAPEEAVLRLWQGLGYYSRARNLHVCARMVVDQFNGTFPNNYKDLLRLKGVGPYTAAAIASIAFQEPVPVVDGNVYRVLARVFGVTEDIASTSGQKIFYALAQSLVPPQRADLYNQAIMEFGAIQCRPAKPLCQTCILRVYCVAFHTGRQQSLPVKSPTLKIKKRFFHYFVIQLGNEVYMKLRKEADIWQGLYDFYLVEDSQLKEADQLADNLVALMGQHQLSITKEPRLYKHALTHRKLYVYFFYVQATARFVQEATPMLNRMHIRAFSLAATKALPKSRLISNFLEEKFYVYFQRINI